MQENILSKLLTECPFSEAFEDMETVKGCSFPVPRRKIGHIRADYDGWRWYNTVWPCHKSLTTPEVCTEIDRVYDALIAPGALKDLAALRKFCADHMDACISKEYEDEFSFYYVGERCNFWIIFVPFGMNNGSPCPITSTVVNRSISRPSLLWSRFLISARYSKYSSRSAFLLYAVP